MKLAYWNQRPIISCVGDGRSFVPRPFSTPLFSPHARGPGNEASDDRYNVTTFHQHAHAFRKILLPFAHYAMQL